MRSKFRAKPRTIRQSDSSGELIYFDRLAQLKKKIGEQRKHLDELESHM